MVVDELRLEFGRQSLDLNEKSILVFRPGGHNVQITMIIYLFIFKRMC